MRTIVSEWPLPITMRSPTLHELPPPPLGKTGWPWTAESPQLSDVMPDGSPWPRISIVTPSYNQGKFIEETIRSVLLQGYPDLEYIIIDGGSSDESVAIIKKYAPWLSYWVSEPDNGQSHAINKAFAKISGTIFSWINSDDAYLSDILGVVAGQRGLLKNQDVIFGDCHLIDESGTITGIWKGYFSRKRDLIRWWSHVYPEGPCWLTHSIFYSTEAIKTVGLLDETLHYSMDYDLWIRLSGRYRFCYLDKVLAVYRFHSSSKSILQSSQAAEKKWFAERIGVSQKYWGSTLTPGYYFYWYSFNIMQWQKKSLLFYTRAEEQYRAGHRCPALRYGLVSLLLLSVNAPCRNHLALLFRLLVGTRIDNAKGDVPGRINNK